MNKVGNHSPPILAQKAPASPSLDDERDARSAAPQRKDASPLADAFDAASAQRLRQAVMGGKPDAARSAFERIKDAVLAYWSKQTNRVVTYIGLGKGALRVWRLLFTGLRGTPLVGNALNALAVLLDTAHASVRTRAHLSAQDDVTRADVIADWTRVATDIGGVFDPLIGLAGALGHSAYSVATAAHSATTGSTDDATS